MWWTCSTGSSPAVMGIRLAALALGIVGLPERFSLRARWVTLGSLLLVTGIDYAFARSGAGLVAAGVAHPARRQQAAPPPQREPVLV